MLQLTTYYKHVLQTKTYSVSIKTKRNCQVDKTWPICRSKKSIIIAFRRSNYRLKTIKTHSIIKYQKKTTKKEKAIQPYGNYRKKGNCKSIVKHLYYVLPTYLSKRVTTFLKQFCVCTNRLSIVFKQEKEN